MKKKIIYGLIIVVIVGGLFVLRNGRKDRNIAQVKTAVAEVGEVKSYLSTTATIRSKNLKDYFGPQAKVKKINVKVGDSVKKGDILIEYETQDLSLSVKQAQLQYDNSILQRNDLYNQNKTITDKIAEIDKQIEALLKNPMGDIKTVDALKQQRTTLNPISKEKLKQSDNSVSLSKLTLDSANQKLADNISSIVAENDGVVTALNVIQGQMSSAVQSTLTVQDIGNLKAIVSLGKYDANKIKVGQDVVIKSGNNSYKGKVSFVDPAASKASLPTGDTSLGAEIDVIDKAQELKVNFDVDVDILIGQAGSILKVPAESVKTGKGNKNYVYVLEGNIVRERVITTNIQSDMEVGIVEGLKEGDKVILNPSTSIKEGVKAAEMTEVK